MAVGLVRIGLIRYCIVHSGSCCHIVHMKQSVALTGRNTTGPPRSVGRAPAGSVTDDDRRQTTRDASEQNNTGPLGGPVII